MTPGCVAVPGCAVTPGRVVGPGRVAGSPGTIAASIGMGDVFQHVPSIRHVLTLTGARDLSPCVEARRAPTFEGSSHLKV